MVYEHLFLLKSITLTHPQLSYGKASPKLETSIWLDLRWISTLGRSQLGQDEALLSEGRRLDASPIGQLMEPMAAREIGLLLAVSGLVIGSSFGYGPSGALSCAPDVNYHM